MSWPLVPFEELFAVPLRNGLTRPSRVRGTGFKMINMGELFAHDKIQDIEMELVPMNEKELESMLVEPGDLLFARQSLVLSGAGKCSIVMNAIKPTTFESHIMRVRVRRDKANPHFYYYYFRSPRSGMKGIVTQGVQAGIRGSDLKRLAVHLPELNKQGRIAEMLEAYDYLIENNRRRIALLEDAARQLYKEWFVRFRFPGHEHVKVVDGLPGGWVRQTLRDVATLHYGKALKDEVRIPGEVPVYGSSGIVGSHNKPLVAGPGIILGRKGNVGSVRWSHSDFFPIDTVYFISSEQSSFHLYLTLENMQFMSTDVAVPGLNRDFAYSRSLLRPEAKVAERFEDEVGPIFSQIQKLTAWAGKLAQARDLLLPKLMNGTLIV